MNKSEEKILIAALQAIEPNYNFLATHGEDALPVIEQLIKGDDDKLAERSIILASRIGTDNSLNLVYGCANDIRDNVRAAVVICTSIFPLEKSISILKDSLRDSSPAIRRLAITSAYKINAIDLIPILKEIEIDDPESVVRDAAQKTVEDFLFQN